MLAVMLGTHSFHPLLCLSPHLLGGAEMSCSLPLRGSMLPYAGTRLGNRTRETTG